MTTGSKATQQSMGGGAVLLASSDRGTIAHFGPSPPVTASDKTPCRYTLLLLKQSATLNVSPSDFVDMQSTYVGSTLMLVTLRV
jgi:hypothetical protein